jgi:alkylation response protein AidB-like acyl-CoA dehydrogenase
VISFRLTTEQEALLKDAQADAEVLRTYMMEGNEAREMHPASMAILLKWGALLIPKDEYGMGADLVTYGLVLVELAKGDPSVALWLAMHCFVMGELARPEIDEETRRKVYALGRQYVFCAAISEDHSTGQLPQSFHPTEVKAEQLADGRWWISGKKSVVSGYRQSERIAVFAHLKGTERTTVCLLVPTHSPGMTEGSAWAKLPFMQTTNSNSVTFDDVIVDAELIYKTDEFLLGAVGSYGARTFAYMAVYLGIFLRALEIVVTRLGTPGALGKPMSENLLVGTPIGECDTMGETARLALLSAMWELDEWLRRREKEELVDVRVMRAMFIAKATVGNLTRGMDLLIEEGGLGGLMNPEFTQALQNMWVNSPMAPKRGIAVFGTGQICLGKNPMEAFLRLMS